MGGLKHSWTILSAASVSKDASTDLKLTYNPSCYMGFEVNTDNAFDYAVYGAHSPNTAAADCAVLATASAHAATSQPLFISAIVSAGYPYICVVVTNKGADASVIGLKMIQYDL